MMAIEPNRTALAVVRAILDAAHPLDISIQGTHVRCEVGRLPAEAWPGPMRGLDEEADGPWPAPISVDCRWQGGSCSVRVTAYDARHGWRDGEVAIAALGERNQQLVFLSLGRLLEDPEAPEVPVEANPSLAKRRVTLSREDQRILNDAIAELLASSGLPMVSRSRLRTFAVDAGTGAVLPSPAVAFRNLVHLALVKLDFIDQPGTAQRGKLVTLPKLGGGVALPSISATLEEEDEDDDEQASGVRRYWAGGFLWDGDSQLERFKANDEWQSGWAEAQHENLAARSTWKRLRKVREGDWFAIKGYGGTNDLVVHYVGEVVAIDLANRTLKLRPVQDAPRYHGQAPTGAGAGAWRDTLVPVTRPDAIKLIFGVSPGEGPAEEPAAPLDLPKNLILYGPPGTGKTWRMQTKLLPKFPGADTITFHQAYSYEDFIEGIRPRLAEGGASSLAYQLEDGLFKRACTAALRSAGHAGSMDEFCRLTPEQRKGMLARAKPHGVFIDEINRGNVARVFGELITLIEADKRLGADNEMIVTLPYSRTRFGVPTNLYVIGTMNTADRSVEALDSALRRRFEFEEMEPLMDAVTFEIANGIDLPRLLTTINQRLERLRDRDHCIGHAYFICLRDDPSLERLKRVFQASIIPLLREYFFGDWGKIGLVLGADFIRKRQLNKKELADFAHDDRDALEDRAVYDLVPIAELTHLSFRRIYEQVDEKA